MLTFYCRGFQIRETVYMKSLLKNKTLKSSISLILVLFFCGFYSFANSAELLSDKEILDIKNEAFALYSTNNKKEALELINKIPQNRRDSDVFVVLGNIYDDLGQRGVAIENFNKAATIDDKAYKAYYNIGCILLKKKSYALAEKNFKLSIKSNSEFAYSYYNLASCYLAKENYSKAKKYLIKAISIKADEKDFYINLAYCYKMLGDDKAAQKIVDSLNSLKTST